MRREDTWNCRTGSWVAPNQGRPQAALALQRGARRQDKANRESRALGMKRMKTNSLSKGEGPYVLAQI